LDAARDLVAEAELPLADPRGELGARLVVAGGVVERDEALHAAALRDEVHVGARAGRELVLVDLADGAAEHDAPEVAEASERELEELAAHRVEVDVDALRRRVFER